MGKCAWVGERGHPTGNVWRSEPDVCNAVRIGWVGCGPIEVGRYAVEVGSARGEALVVTVPAASLPIDHIHAASCNEGNDLYSK